MNLLAEKLEVGDILEIQLDDEGDWKDEWITVPVKSVSVCHNPRPAPILDPYVGVGIDHPKLSFFNYSMYCAGGHVRHRKAVV